MTVLSTLGFTVLAFLFLGVAQFTVGLAGWCYCRLANMFTSVFIVQGSDGSRIAGGAFGMAASFTAWWGAMTGFWSETATYSWVRLPAIPLQ